MSNQGVTDVTPLTLGVHDLLPVFEVYTGSRYTHFLPECVGGTLEKMSFWQVEVDVRCVTCYTPEREVYDGLHEGVDQLEQLERMYSEAASIVASIEAGIVPETEALVCAVHDVFVGAPEELEALTAFEQFRLLVKQISSMVETLKAPLLPYIRSTKGREQLDYIPRVEPSILGWKQEDNALMFTLENLEYLELALGLSYGVEVTPGKFVAYGPPTSLAYISGATASSPFYLADDTPLEVLATAVSLWERRAATVLGDANNALNAAWDLTPTV